MQRAEQNHITRIREPLGAARCLLGIRGLSHSATLSLTRRCHLAGAHPDACSQDASLGCSRGQGDVSSASRRSQVLDARPKKGSERDGTELPQATQTEQEDRQRCCRNFLHRPLGRGARLWAPRYHLAFMAGW